MPASVIPTFASGTLSIMSGSGTFNINADSTKAGSADGYVNQIPAITVGSFNAFWNSEVLSPRAPVAGLEGNQS